MSALELDLQISSLHTTMRALTRRFTSDRDESLDLVQDTILKALSHKGKFREDTNLEGWLFTIMRNTFINNYRKEQRANVSRDYGKGLHLLKAEDTNTFSKPAAKLEYTEIRKMVNSLSDELLIPFKMLESGYKYHEIAEHQKIPLGTVKNRIFRARKELQKKLTQY